MVKLEDFAFWRRKRKNPTGRWRYKSDGVTKEDVLE